MATTNQLQATTRSITDLINQGMLGSTDQTFGHLDHWIQTLQSYNTSATTVIAKELQNLKLYIGSNDTAQISATLQKLGAHTAASARDIHDAVGIGDQLRHLGQVLAAASGNVKTLV